MKLLTYSLQLYKEEAPKQEFRSEFCSSLKVFFIERLWRTASVIGHVTLFASDQEYRNSHPELLY